MNFLSLFDPSQDDGFDEEFSEVHYKNKNNNNNNNKPKSNVGKQKNFKNQHQYQQQHHQHLQQQHQNQQQQQQYQNKGINGTGSSCSNSNSQSSSSESEQDLVNNNENEQSKVVIDLDKGILPPEPQLGNIEYKLKLVNPSKQRFEHLVTQMKWRLREGHGEAIYEIGVSDSGHLHGLNEKDMNASLATLKRMAHDLGASTTVLRQKYVAGRRSVTEVLVRKIPDDQYNIEVRVAVLGGAAADIDVDFRNYSNVFFLNRPSSS